MKKILILILLILLGIGGYYGYNYYFNDKIPVLKLEQEIINIDELYTYGTHLNIHGNIVNQDNLDLVLYNGEFKEIKININNEEGTFNLSDYVNDGLYLDDLSRGYYYIFMRYKDTDENGNVIYKYYSLNNTTEYKETIYYTFSNYNNKITIGSEEEYSTMFMNIEENVDNDIYDVVIDPGHGGIDGGAERYGYNEAYFTLKIAEEIKDILEENGLKVKLTHSEGELSSNDRLYKYGVHGRAVISSEVKAKYLFSIHINCNNVASVNGLEIYTADNINYDFATLIRDNIIKDTSLNYSNNKTNKIMDGIYTRNFTKSEVEETINDYIEDGYIPYDVTTKSNYYYIIRETGGIITGAYYDDRNEEIDGNPYYNSNTGTEAYLLELGYISNKSDLDNLNNNLNKYVNAISNSIMSLYK